MGRIRNTALPGFSRRLSELVARGRAFGRFLGVTAKLMVGLPDYDGYVEHRRTHHPGAPIMSRKEFFRERQSARYGGNGRINRCC
jgi:uncharacterized short protein YbdD (DUF466 family)